MEINEQFNKNENKNLNNLKEINEYPKNSIGAGKNNIDNQKVPKLENNLKTNNKKKKKLESVSKIITTFATMISAIFLVGAVGTLLPPKDNIIAEIHEVYATEHNVSFFITIEEFDNNDNVYVVLYNDFTNRKLLIQEQAFQGNFEDLQKDMTYTLAVKKGSKTITSVKVKTVGRESQGAGGTNG